MNQPRKIQIGDTISKIAASAPTVNDDVSLGYDVSSLWFDSVFSVMYICADATNGVAVWTPLPAIQSLTGLNVNLGDPLNPVLGISVDGISITGAGTPGSPLVGVAGSILALKVSVNSATILNLNAAPLQLIAAPAAGYTLQILAVSGRLNFGTIAYATNTKLITYFTGGSQWHNANGLLNSGATHTRGFDNSGAAALMDEGSPFILSVATGNPTAGDGTLDVYITYRIVQL